jgi:hypothetical protein
MVQPLEARGSQWLLSVDIPRHGDATSGLKFWNQHCWFESCEGPEVSKSVLLIAALTNGTKDLKEQ